MTTYILEVTTETKKSYFRCSSKYGAQQLRERITKYEAVLETRILIPLPDGYLYPIHEEKT